ncbi:hypothetical protein ACNQFN_18855 [Thauera butanivorans]|uniref:hypothetical protein n=1 Tax=Thauera butanivorans TaxID=86174 RepID=UPI003AB62DE8
MKPWRKAWCWLLAVVLLLCTLAVAGIVSGRLASTRILEAAQEAVGHAGDARYAAYISRWGTRNPEGYALACVFVTDAAHGGDFGEFVVVETKGPFDEITAVLTRHGDEAGYNHFYSLVCPSH